MKCETDHPCCEVSETVWKNIETEIVQVHDKIVRKRTEYEDLEKRRHEIEVDCPDIDFTPFLLNFHPIEVVTQEENTGAQTSQGPPALD